MPIFTLLILPLKVTSSDKFHKGVLIADILSCKFQVYPLLYVMIQSMSCYDACLHTHINSTCIEISTHDLLSIQSNITSYISLSDLNDEWV